MKVSLQQLLAFRTSTDQVARSRLSGVVNGQQPVSSPAQTAREAGPALTLLATSDTFIAESFFVSAGPFLGEYQTRSQAPGALDLRNIDVPRHLLGTLVQKLLQGADGREADVIARLMAMPVVGEEPSTHDAAPPLRHASGYVTFYNSDHDHADVYAVVFKPDRHEVEVALYRNAREFTVASQRPELLPAIPFFRQRVDLTPLLEAAAQRSFGAFAHPFRPESEVSLMEEERPSLRNEQKRMAVIAGLAGGLACILAIIWFGTGG